MEYWLERRRAVGGEPGESGGAEGAAAPQEGAGDKEAAGASFKLSRASQIKPRASAAFTAPKTRHLSVKLEMLVDLMARTLHYNNGTNEVDSFSYNEVVKTLKKVDHQLGT